ncbi:MAG: hypothetical protein Q9201_004110 [Fulgogasparrea decipioides]
MVKADPKCDYYADLELPPSADALEIKRQFKKLALKYHPDRNPGRELEFNAKFQAIQAAHEVLADPQQRAKYDADRIRSGTLHTYNTSSVRPNPPPRAAASNFPPPPQRTPQASSRTNFPPPPSSGASRYSAYMRTDPTNANKSPADDAKARANAFKAWEQMRYGQGVPHQSRPVPPRPTKTGAFQSGSYPPKEAPPRTTWDQTKESHPDFPKMARSNTTRVPKKSGFAPGFSAGDEPPARNTSAYFNVLKGERPDISRPDSESRPVPPPPPASSNQRSTPKRPDHLNSWRAQHGAEDPFASNDRISTPYATSGGEKTYFTSTGLGRQTTSRERPNSGDFYDSEPMAKKTSHNRTGSATSPRGHHSASPKLRSPRPVSISSTSSSSSSSDESLREGVENLYTSAGTGRKTQSRNPNGHLRPSYKPFIGPESVEEDKGMPPRSRSDAAEKQTRFEQKPQFAGSTIDPSSTEGFMEHRLKHEAERNQGLNNPVCSPRSNDFNQPLHRPLHRPKSWHEKYGAAGQDQGKDNQGRPVTGDQSAKPSMYGAHGFDPIFFTPCSQKWFQQWPFGGTKPLAAPSCPKMPPPYWAIPSSISPRRRRITQEYDRLESRFQPFEKLITEKADNILHRSFNFPNSVDGRPTHPPPLRSHSSDTISVNFSPSDWHGKFTGKPEEYFEPPTRRTNVARGRTSPTKRQAPLSSQTQPPPSAEGHQLPNSTSHMPPPPPPQPTQREEYSPDKWAPYFKPGTLNWPPPPPHVGVVTRGVSKKRPKTPSRRDSRTVFKRAAIPKPATVAPAVDDADEDTASSNLASASSHTSSAGSAMDLDTSTSPPSAGKQRPSSIVGAKEATPRPPVPPRPTATPRAQPPPDNAHLDLGNLKNVAPFAPNQEGIRDLNDLTTALPFESKASVQSAEPPLSPRKLELPNPPKPPIAPEKLTQGSWERYLAAMRVYMFEWNAYNTKVLAHFNERQASVETTLKPESLSAVGEGTENWGFGKYMQGVEEDFRVREHWDLSWERHRECMRALGGVRAKLLGSSVKVLG